MLAPAFWWQAAPSPLAVLLRPASRLYGALAARRMTRPGARAAVPVVCVGNFTVGGAGKTPAALALAQLLARGDEKPVFLSRGHGGRLAGPVEVDPARHGAADVGDEPLLLARAGPTIVARDRVAGAALAVKIGAGVVVMDDGLQNPSLFKDFSICVVDGATGIGNGLPLPAGPLRAPMTAQWRAVDAVLILGEGEAGDAVAQEAAARGRPVLRARIVPDEAAAARLRGQRVLAFAGIGRPQKLFATLRDCGAALVVERPFPDHHSYTAAEVARLAAEALAGGLALVTTEKDEVRIAGLGMPVQGLTVMPVRLELADEGGVQALLREALVRRR